MKFCNAMFLLLLAAVAAAGPATAQDATVPTAADSAAAEAAEAALKYEDYTVKAYTLTVFGGSFSGARFLDLQEIGPKTVVTPGNGDNVGPGEILGYDGRVLLESRQKFEDGRPKFDAAQKEIRSGAAYGARIGIYISDNFHLDMTGTYAQGTAVTTMIERDQFDPNKKTRVQLDEDDGFVMYKGGLAVNYDAVPAKFWGIVPRLGFGLGGIINRFSELEDKTSLYLEGNLALTRDLGDRLRLVAQADVTNFAFQVDELGYSNMLNYATFSIGLSYFVDVLPSDVRAKRLAELER